jgi:hypothetical protein
MIYLLLCCVLIIWVAMIYGFCIDDMGMGYFGRIYAGLAHGAIATIALATLGGLIFVTSLAIREIL